MLKDIEVREFGLAPEWIRVSWMAFLASILLVPGMLWNRSRVIENYDFWHSPEEWATLILLLSYTVVPASALLLMVYRWRLRVDTLGLHRRRFFRWQTWTWEDFRSGRVGRGIYAGSFFKPTDPWWRLGLSLGYLREADGEYVRQLCLRFWTAPALEPPASLTLKMPKIGFGRTTVSMGSSGIDLAGPGLIRSYSWDDVKHLYVARIEEKHPGFRVLKLVLPDRELELRFDIQNGGEVRNWGGPKPDVLSAFLIRHVPADRIEEAVLTGGPKTVEDVEARLTAWRKQYRQFVMIVWVLAAIVAGAAVWTGVGLVRYYRHHPTGSFLDYLLSSQVLGIWAMLLLYVTPVMTFHWVTFRKAHRKLQEERTRLAKNGEVQAAERHEGKARSVDTGSE